MLTIEERLNKIEDRNKRVEDDKAWETSNTRKILIIVFTYIAIGFYLDFINVQDSWINAVVPTIGFTLSTMAMPTMKKWWIKNIYKKT